MRQAIMAISRELLEQMLGVETMMHIPQGERVQQWILRYRYDVLHERLKLPANAKITGVSTDLYFDRDEVAIRVECSEFREVPFNGKLWPVQAMYFVDSETTRFDGWSGAAVEQEAPAVAVKQMTPEKMREYREAFAKSVHDYAAKPISISHNKIKRQWIPVPEGTEPIFVPDGDGQAVAFKPIDLDAEPLVIGPFSFDHDYLMARKESVPRMSKEEFDKMMVRRSGVSSIDELRKSYDTLPCSCGDKFVNEDGTDGPCPGWRLQAKPIPIPLPLAKAVSQIGMAGPIISVDMETGVVSGREIGDPVPADAPCSPPKPPSKCSACGYPLAQDSGSVGDRCSLHKM